MSENGTRDDILQRLLDEDMGGEFDNNGVEKIASDMNNPLDLSEDDLIKIAEFNYEQGRIRAKGFMAEVRQQQMDFFKAAGLTPELLQKSLEKEAAAGGLSSYPHTDYMSKVLTFIMNKIHPHMMINSYRPGESRANTGNMNPDNNTSLATEDAVIADHRRTQKVEAPTSPFRLRKNKTK